MYIFQNLLNLEKMAIHTVAIVIGVSQFENSKLETLPGARNDAILFANSLRNWGLEEKDIHLFLDLEASSETIVSCFEQLAALNEPFKLTFCYCGHGSRSLLPHPQSYLHLYDGKLSLDELLKSIYRLNAQENYLFIDACHLRINSLVNPELEREIQGKGDSRKSLFCLLSSGIEQ